jgi:predicted RNase H-like HicB family nuclease
MDATSNGTVGEVAWAHKTEQARAGSIADKILISVHYASAFERFTGLSDNYFRDILRTGISRHCLAAAGTEHANPDKIRAVEKLDPAGVYEVRAQWDGEAGVWVAESDDVPGLVAEADSPKVLVQKLKILIPELLELNGAVHGQTASFHVLYQHEDSGVLTF